MAERVACPACDREIAVRGGRLVPHGPRAGRCAGTGRPPTSAGPGGLVESITARLAELDRQTPGAGRGWQAALALELAQDIVRHGDETISARTSAAKQLRALMADLEATAPAAKKTTSTLDELAARRDARQAAAR